MPRVESTTATTTSLHGGPPTPTHVVGEDEDDALYDEEEDEEVDQRDPHAALVDHVRSDNQNNREALAYLLRYETMIRQQEAEDMATMAHLRPCLERLKELLPKESSGSSTTQGGGNNSNNDSKEDAPELLDKQQQQLYDDVVWTRQISYTNLRKALEILEMQEPTEFMTTDRQLMMILRLLTQSTTTGKDRTGPEATLTWAELVQCYKTCIVGMTTLQHLPNVDETRQRTRDRTLAMLALFEPTSRLWSSPVAHPTRSTVTANTSALSSTQRSSFAPVRSVKPQKDRKIFYVIVATVMAIVGMGFYYYASTLQTKELLLPHQGRSSNSKRSMKPSTTSASRRPAPTFNVRSFVPTSTSATLKQQLSSSNIVNDFLEEDQEEMGVVGPALLVATVGTPFVAVLTQNMLQQFGRGTAFIAATASLSTIGNVLVTVAGFLSLTSLVLRSIRALFRGLGRLGEPSLER